MIPIDQLIWIAKMRLVNDTNITSYVIDNGVIIPKHHPMWTAEQKAKAFRNSKD